MHINAHEDACRYLITHTHTHTYNKPKKIFIPSSSNKIYSFMGREEKQRGLCMK